MFGDDADTSMLSEHDTDIPEESIVDTESSNGWGFVEFDASDQEDEDYVINAEESSEGLAKSEPDMWIVKKPVKEKKEVCQSPNSSLLHQYTHLWPFLRSQNKENSGK